MIYRYRHDACGHEESVSHGMGEQVWVGCPMCPNEAMRIVVSADSIPAAKIKNGGEGYQPGLARRPNDPKAWVDGPRMLRKKVDQAKRRAEAKGGYLEDVSKKDDSGPDTNKTASLGSLLGG